MKKFILSFVAIFALFQLNAQQVDDEVSLGANYAYQSYYSLSDGEVANVINDDWDLAFETGYFGVSIRINSQNGIQLYMYENGDTSDWATMDTTDISSWTQYYDSINYWGDGAFNRGVDTSETFDFGWGIYNPFTHNVVGDSLFVIQLSDLSYRKIWIESMIISGDSINEYLFKYANLDGTDEISVVFDKLAYSDKLFAYYSIQNEEVIDREPLADSWDIVFTKYWDFVFGQGYYGVTGVLINNNVENSQADDVDVDLANWSDYPMSDTISIMGWDWKFFNFNAGDYEIIEDRCYFIKDLDGIVWKLIFTDFIGLATGEIYFTKEEVGVVGVDEFNNITDFAVYPNPATNGFVTVQFINPASSVLTRITDLSGKEVFAERFSSQGEQTQQINVSTLSTGLYILSIENETSRVSKKLIIK